MSSSAIPHRCLWLGLFVLAARLTAGPIEISPTSADSRTIEEAILWRAPIHRITWEPMELKKLLSNPDLFTPKGNFFEARAELKAFGHKVTYVGIVGVDMCSGPNVTVEGSVATVCSAIEQAYGLKLTVGESGAACDLVKDVRLLIWTHPTKPDETIIVGAYFGR